MQTEHLISVKRPDIVLIDNKRITSFLMDFALPADNRTLTKESKKLDKYLDIDRKQIRKTMKHNGDTDHRWYT